MSEEAVAEGTIQNTSAEPTGETTQVPPTSVLIGSVEPPPSAPPAEEQTGEAAKEEAPKETVVPEKYEFTLPEGFTLDEAIVAKFEPIAKGLKLDNATAQSLVDVFVEAKQEEAKAQAEFWKQTSANWEHEIRTQHGQGFDQALSAANAALAAFVPEAQKSSFFAFLKQSGIGNHPALFATFHAIGKDMSEPSFHKGSAPAEARSAEQVLYPTMTRPKT